MAKFYGTATKTGRVGGVVYRINRGTTIESQYQPVVNNPRTTRQVGQRAKMKLASLVAAIMSEELGAFRPQGMVSSRNRFIADLFNREVISYANGTATMNTAKIKLTPSCIAMGNIASVNREGSVITARVLVLPEYVAIGAQVRILAVQKRDVSGGEAEVAITTAATIAVHTEEGYYDATLNVRAGNAVLLAYVFVPSTNTLVKYGNIFSETANQILLETIRLETPSGVDYSETMAYVSNV